MFQRFSEEMKDILKKEENCILILMGIRQYTFRECRKYCPQRVIDTGIMEPAAVGIAAGMAAKGLVPFLHTWTPFLVERAYEQLKLDFGCQKLGGNFIGAGASYDLTAYGDSHYCPSDVPILKQIRNMQIAVPGTADEFAALFRAAYNNGYPTYYRLSENVNHKSHIADFGKASVLRKGSCATILAVGPMLDYILPAAEEYDVTVLYYTTVVPFDRETLRKYISGHRIMIAEPYHKGAVLGEVVEALSGYPLKIELIGFEVDSVCSLGEYSENISDWGFDQITVKRKLEKLLEE
ncbi:MAG: hypothetical protein HFI22_05270 [Lachnospiraceae bacterium]|jgi:transketolase|nr:hypothetical protein [Lachnospiraceae bacterium]